MDLNYKVFGEGEPIIILHGLFGMLDNWQSIGRKLAEHYMVFLIDQRNHGKSPNLPDISYPLMAQDLAEFMEKHWIHQAHIIGHSMGGKTAMQFALEHPNMVQKLLIIDIATKAYQGNHQEIFDALFSLDLQQIANRKQADNQLLENVKDFGVRQFLLKNLSRTKEGHYRWKFNLDVLHNNYDNILGEVKGDFPFENPTLFIRGSRSNYIEDSDFEDIKHWFPEADIETVYNVGHWVHAEAPEELLKLITSFLET